MTKHSINWTPNSIRPTELNVNLGDQIDFTCSNQYKIDAYLVDQNSYHNCQLNTAKRKFLTCRTPNKPTIKTVNILEVNPFPRAIEFRTGRDYYIISTNNATQPLSKGGFCESDSLKLKISVQDSLVTDLPRVEYSPEGSSDSIDNHDNNDAAFFNTSNTDSNSSSRQLPIIIGSSLLFLFIILLSGVFYFDTCRSSQEA